MAIIVRVTMVAEIKVKDEEEMEKLKEDFSINWYSNEILYEDYSFESWEA
jgi:hypothetical protein